MMRIIALVLTFLLAAPAWADEARLDVLFDALQTADADSWEQIEDQIWDEWSKSGSPAMDLLLDRGRRALGDDDAAVAVEHLTALVENAPDFAEGWNARATALFTLGYYGPALSDIAHVLTLEPRHFGAWAGLGLILEDTGDLDGAAAAYAAALAVHPHRPDLIEALDRVRAALGGKDI